MTHLFIGGHHDGGRIATITDGVIPAHVALKFSLGTDHYTLRHIPPHTLFYAPSSWSDDDAMFALINGYHGPADAHTSLADIIDDQRREIVRLQAQVSQMLDSKVREP